ncbi:dehydrogenase with different specificitie [Aspergillus campestris IBT 28561]|uniref:Dehydrogenase with different specificitie n=1 Tax=Aspergillus campestris (strain IBT 28561) TaxID=1392248 RepID=A0A2I1D1J7_ASPC2|nr:dehydrogenase with different specificitie [Aspergillus campestris IBT 28561]PKY03753.1 dehydrogenase with different specificitie [Aspergillus campestris IBT 28561]
MPIPLITQGIRDGISSIPYAAHILRVAPWVLILAALKYYFGGARNGSERVMHSKVVMVTGGTSGIGASVVHELASRGAQVIILTQHSPSDIFLVDYIEDVRRSTGNHLVFAEQVDLSSLHSVRTFATKWIDNVPARRLDMLILCANTASPSSSLLSTSPRRVTQDGLDEEWQVNYLSNFHLLSILSPALRAQPAHRDVRVIFTTCASYMGARLDLKQADTAPVPATHNLPTQSKSKPNSKQQTPPPKNKPSSLFGVSKLSLMVFAHTFQKHLNAVKRPDNQPPCTRVLVVDPGFSRTPGMRRWLTGGSLWGLLFYLITWPVWWLILKSPQQGAQSILYAAMEARYGRGEGGWMIKECCEVGYARHEITDEAVAKRLWEFSEKQIETVETETAIKRALASKEKQAQAEAEAQMATPSAGTKDAAPGSRRSRKGQNPTSDSASASASASSARK